MTAKAFGLTIPPGVMAAIRASVGAIRHNSDVTSSMPLLRRADGVPC